MTAKTQTMILALPEGGQAMMSWPKNIQPESVEMMAECLMLQVRVIRRASAQQHASAKNAADIEYESWLSVNP